MNKQWAYDLAKRERSLERLTLAQRTMWRAALGRESEVPSVNGEFSQVDDGKLPPQMQTARDEAGRPVPPT